MRGIAILLVVLYHAGLPIPGGFLGVDVFFVISGYVIAAGLLRRLETDGSFSLRDFYARRVRRLLPALGVLLVAVCLASVLLLSPLGPQQQTARLAIFSAVWLANVAAYQLPTGYFESSTDDYPLIHIWSLSVEEQFYLLFPILLLVVWKWRRRLSDLRLLMWIGTITSFFGAVLLIHGRGAGLVADPQGFAFYSSPSRAWEFGVGALVAAYAVGPRDRPSVRLGAPLSAIAGISLVGSALFVTSADLHPGPVTTIPVLATALLIWSRPAWLTSRALVWTGDLSYSWYLWHWPFITFTALLISPSTVALTVAAIISLAPAWWSYRRVENRFRRTPPSDSLPPSKLFGTAPRLAIVSVASALVAGFVLGSGGAAYWGKSAVTQFATETDPLPLAYRLGCTDGVGPSALVGTQCEINSSATGGRVVLVGDSNAAMYSDGLASAVKQTDQSLLISAVNSCPLMDVPQRSIDFDSARCAKYVEDTMADLLAMPPATIITAAAGNQIVNPNIELADQLGQSYSADASVKTQRWQAGLTDALSQLVAAGHRVILMQVIPQFPDGNVDYWRPTDCPMATLFIGPTTCSPALSLESMDERQQPVLSAIKAAADDSGVELADFRNELCPGNDCSAYQGMVWVYRDGNHLSTIGSEQLTAHLADLLLRR